jgi:hypothetical protein
MWRSRASPVKVGTGSCLLSDLPKGCSIRSLARDGSEAMNSRLAFSDVSAMSGRCWIASAMASRRISGAIPASDWGVGRVGRPSGISLAEALGPEAELAGEEAPDGPVAVSPAPSSSSSSSLSSPGEGEVVAGTRGVVGGLCLGRCFLALGGVDRGGLNEPGEAVATRLVVAIGRRWVWLLVRSMGGESDRGRTWKVGPAVVRAEQSTWWSPRAKRGEEER